jgi:hypothetical protein
MGAGSVSMGTDASEGGSGEGSGARGLGAGSGASGLGASLGSLTGAEAAAGAGRSSLLASSVYIYKVKISGKISNT